MTMLETSNKRRTTPVKPAFRASALGTPTTGTTTPKVTVPAASQPGDLAIFILAQVVGSTITPPVGPVLAFADGAVVGPLGGYLYTARVVASGDPKAGTAGYVTAGQLLTWTMSITNPYCLLCVVYSGTSGLSMAPVVQSKPANSVTNTPIRWSAIKLPSWRTSTDLHVLAGCAYPQNTSNTNQTATTPVTPSGFTQRAMSVAASNGLSTTRGAFLFDGNFTAGDITTNTNPSGTNQTCNYVTWAFTLAPATEPQALPVPPSLAGKTIHCYGESLAAGWITPIGSSTYWGYQAESPWVQRIQRLFGSPAGANNMAAGGMYAADIAMFAASTITAVTRASPSTNRALTQPGTWWLQANRTACIVLTELLGNDWLNSGGGQAARRLLGAKNAVIALLRVLRAASYLLHTDASVVKVGAWTTASGTAWAGGSAVYSTTPGDKFTITTTATDVDLVLVGLDDDAAAVNPGAAFSVNVDGVVKATGTTSRQHLKPNDSNPYFSASQTFSLPYGPMIVSLENLGVGTHTIEVTHTGLSGEQLTFNMYMTRSATPPLAIVLNKLPSISAEGLALLGGAVTNADAAPFNSMLDDVCALFNDGTVFTYDPLLSGLWDPETCCATDGDGIHHSDRGTAHYTLEIPNLLRERFS